jgi:mannan endo-1,4-beta-mannosidase
MVLLVAWVAWTPLAAAIEPADALASDDARRVLAYLAELPSRSRNRVLSGQFVCSAAVEPGQQAGTLNDTPGCYERYVTALHRQSGRWVALVGGDYARLGDAWRLDLSRTNEPLIAHWRRGGLVTVGWHARNPWTGGDARDKSVIGNIDELLDESTQAHAAWMQALDQIAAGLAQLQQAGVVVLWRPLHESNEPAFWWGAGQPNAPSPEQMVRLWQHMFDYFTRVKQLHNLLWVYSVTPREKPGTQPELLTYPGDAYVDVVGVDQYADELVISAYDQLVALGKPFGLTEFGPAVETAQAHSYDYGRLIEQIRRRYPRISFVQCWSGSGKSPKAWALVVHRNADAFLRDPWVATADEVRWQPRRGRWWWPWE